MKFVRGSLIMITLFIMAVLAEVLVLHMYPKQRGELLPTRPPAYAFFVVYSLIVGAAGGTWFVLRKRSRQ